MIPKFGPDEPFSHDSPEPRSPYSGKAYEPTGKTVTTQIECSAADLVNPDGKSTLILAIRLGFDPTGDADLVLAQAIPRDFLDFLRTKDVDAKLRNHIADYLHDVAEQWRSGTIFKS
jgi:hypothetical protein